MAGSVADHDDERPSRTGSVVQRAMLRFAVFTVVATVLLIVATVVLAARLAQNQALRDARVAASAIARTMAAPLVDQAVRTGQPGAASELNTVLGHRMQDGSVRHLKLWASDGTVIWADEKDLVGRRFFLPEDVSSLFGTTEATADVSDLSKPENAGERGHGKLLEVYVGAYDRDLKPLVFEAYMPAAGLERDEISIIKGVLPLAIGGLLLFQLAVLPLALSLARRVERTQKERAKMMRHALLASDLERRRIANDLHDGVIQDLAGLAYALPGVQAKLATPEGTAAAQDMLTRTSGILKRDVTSLRSLLNDIYPPDLHGEGLVAAINDLAESTSEASTRVRVLVSPDLNLPIDAARLAYRVVREGLRNVVKHAEASSVVVEVLRAGNDVVVLVTDDGQGVTEANGDRRGHLGLRLLEDTVRDFGGRVRLLSAPVRGSVLEASFPEVLVH
jgi:signal transduction histidine kinase